MMRRTFEGRFAWASSSPAMAAAARKGASESGSVPTGPVMSRNMRRSIGPTSHRPNIATMPQSRSY